MDPKPVYFARNSTEATMVQHWLEDAGISSQIMGGELNSGALDIVETDPVVIVSVEDFEKASEAVEQFRLELESGGGLSEMSDAEGQFNWPICPQCDELREATCTSCNTTSNEYSADIGDEDLDVHCLACSQQVDVVFADHCRYCNHDFTAVESSIDNAEYDAPHMQANHGRVMLVVIALGILSLAIAIWYFTTMT